MDLVAQGGSLAADVPLVLVAVRSHDGRNAVFSILVPSGRLEAALKSACADPQAQLPRRDLVCPAGSFVRTLAPPASRRLFLYRLDGRNADGPEYLGPLQRTQRQGRANAG